jgi:hypothetical protein
LITLKMAVFAPMPSANVIYAMAVNVGAISNRRNTCFRTFMDSITTQAAWRVQNLLPSRPGPY